MEITRCSRNDAAALTEIVFAAKRHWDYPELWIRQWSEQLTITPAFIAENTVFAAHLHGQIIGFYGLRDEGRKAFLDHLWVIPDRIGTGVGRALFMHAAELAAKMKAEVIELESDPNAEKFYERMGARRIGETIFDIAGQRRILPIMVFELFGRVSESERRS
jgi:GNAT superfamily N-acetyltransferase